MGTILSQPYLPNRTNNSLTPKPLATNPRSGFIPPAVRDALKVQFTSIAAWWFVQNTMLKPHLACAAMTSPTRLPRYPLHTAWGIRFICQWQLVPPLFYPMLATPSISSTISSSIDPQFCLAYPAFMQVFLLYMTLRL